MGSDTYTFPEIQHTWLRRWWVAYLATALASASSIHHPKFRHTNKNCALLIGSEMKFRYVNPKKRFSINTYFLTPFLHIFGPRGILKVFSIIRCNLFSVCVSLGLSTLRRAEDGGVLPSARAVSNAISPHNNIPHHLNTLALMQWGQFLDHDLTSTPVAKLATSPGKNLSVAIYNSRSIYIYIYIYGALHSTYQIEDRQHIMVESTIMYHLKPIYGTIIMLKAFSWLQQTTTSKFRTDFFVG